MEYKKAFPILDLFLYGIAAVLVIGFLSFIFFKFIKRNSFKELKEKVGGPMAAVAFISLAIGYFLSDIEQLEYSPNSIQELSANYFKIMLSPKENMPKYSYEIKKIIESKEVIKEAKDTLQLICSIGSKMICSAFQDVSDFTEYECEDTIFKFSENTNMLKAQLSALTEEDCPKALLWNITQELVANNFDYRVRIAKGFAEEEYLNGVKEGAKLNVEQIQKIYEEMFSSKFK